MCFLLNDIADDVIFSFTNNLSWLEILFSSYFEVEVKCFKKHLSNNTSLKSQAALNKFRGYKSSNKSIVKVLKYLF